MGLKTQIGKVTGTSITKNKDGDRNVLMLQVELTDSDDIQSVQFMSQSGEDTNPVIDSMVTVINISESFKVAIASDDGITPYVDQGEKEFYSSVSGTKKAILKLKADGLTAIVSPDESIDLLFSDFIDAIVAIVTTGSPTTHIVNAVSQAALNVIKTRFTKLFGGL